MEEKIALVALSLNSHYKHRLGFLGRLQHGARLNEVEEGGGERTCEIGLPSKWM